MVQLVDHAPPKRWVGWIRFSVTSHRRFVKRYLWPVHALSCWALMGEWFTCVLPLTYQQCSNHCQSSRVDHGAGKRRWVPQTTRDTPEGLQNPSINETELSGRFNHKSHVTDKGFTEFDMNVNQFQLRDRKSAKVSDGKCSLFCGPAKYLRGPVPVRRPAVENHWIRMFFSALGLQRITS